MMAIAEVTETLYLFVDCKDLQPALTYTSELHTVTWDLLASHNKLQLKIEIVSAAMAPHAWDDAFMLPDLGAVYGQNDVARQHTKLLSRTGLLPVAYRSPELELRRFSRPGMSYFDDQENRGLRHAIVLVQGAFDHLHNGHRRLLSLAAGVCSERLVVGITAAPQLLALKPFAELIEPLETRKLKVRDFVTSVCPTLSVEFVDVHDPWGPAATFDDSRTLLVISSSDMDLFDAIRARRLAGDFFARIVRRSHRATLSSSRIREAIAKASR
jgi:cytidyltransferase-like protein